MTKANLPLSGLAAIITPEVAVASFVAQSVSSPTEPR